MEVLRLTGFSLTLVATSVDPSADFSCSSDCSCLDKGVDFISKCFASKRNMTRKYIPRYEELHLY